LPSSFIGCAEIPKGKQRLFEENAVQWEGNVSTKGKEELLERIRSLEVQIEHLNRYENKTDVRQEGSENQ